ncbi:MAG: DUF5659 domain-containing protein [Candidatus Saccharimonadales bacterium]|jgi:hypothetical protein
MSNYNSYEFRTFDLALSSALVTEGFLVIGIEKSSAGKATFLFETTPALKTAVDNYWSDKLKVNPKAYFDAMKHLKTRIYSGV